MSQPGHQKYNDFFLKDKRNSIIGINNDQNR